MIFAKFINQEKLPYDLRGVFIAEGFYEDMVSIRAIGGSRSESFKESDFEFREGKSLTGTISNPEIIDTGFGLFVSIAIGDWKERVLFEEHIISKEDAEDILNPDPKHSVKASPEPETEYWEDQELSEDYLISDGFVEDRYRNTVLYPSDFRHIEKGDKKSLLESIDSLSFE